MDIEKKSMTWKIVIIFLLLGAMVLISLAWFHRWKPWFILEMIPLPLPRPEHIRHSEPWQEAIQIIGTFLTLYITGIFLLYLFPEKMKKMSIAVARSGRNPFRFLLLGLMIIFLIVILLIGSALAMGTFPLVFLVGAAVFIGSIVGEVCLAFTLGKVLLVQAEWYQGRPLRALFFGNLLIYAAISLPFVGAFLLISVASIGLGTLIATRFGSSKSWSLRSLIEEGEG